MNLLMTQAEFAARHGVSAPCVSNWKKRSLLVWADDPDRPGKQKIDAEKSDLLVRGTIDPTRGRPRSEGAQAAEDLGAGEASPSPRQFPPALNGLEAARLDEMRERTTRRRLENQQLVGSLVPLAEYERRAGELGRVVRERAHGLIRQMAERVAAETDPRTVISVLGEAFDALFAQVADEIEAAASAETAADAALVAELGDEDLEDEEEADGA